MMNLIQKFLSKNRSSQGHIRKNFSTYFFSLPEHEWIRDQTKLHFQKLFEHLPAGILEAMMTRHPVVFITSEKMKNRQQLEVVMANTIVVFPEFQKLLKSPRKSAVAYLAHEVAFLFLELEGLQSDSLMAEIEADKFVSDLGLIFELEEFLLMLDESIEKRLRLTYLTITHFKDY